ncbi:MAG: PQQ-dependent sugar dehydrogenase [Bacteroidales bacterium]
MRKNIFLFLFGVFLIPLASCNNTEKDFSENLFENDIRIRIDTLATGLQNPWGLEFLPDGRILIAERPGRLRIFQDGQLLPAAVEGLPAIWAHGQGGLLDVVMHPDYQSNQWLYLAYAAPGPGGGNTTIGRGRLEGNQWVDFQQIFQGQPLTSSGAHFGSRIVFDNDNYLFTTIGDRGVMQSSQDLSNHNGTVIRLYDDGSIPADNPFVGTPGARPEIWSYGHRNIQGMVFHPQTGDLWTHEHGPRGGDEINVIFKGANYGWPRVTHGVNYSGTTITPDTTLAGMVDPILHWTPSIAPCGLEIVTSNRYGSWQGNLLVGALAGQHIHRVVLEGRQVVHTEKLLEGFARFRAVRQGPDGLLYVLTESPGMMIRLMPEE